MQLNIGKLYLIVPIADTAEFDDSTFTIDEVETPSVIVDLDVLERNVLAMAALAERHRVKLRPMVKTHKSPVIAGLQSDAGACGVLVATIGEAEAMAAAGIEDVCLAYPPVGVGKCERLARLARNVRLTLSVDSSEAVRLVHKIAAASRCEVAVELLVDCGSGRLGSHPREVVRIAREFHDGPHVWFAGVATHAGQVYGCTDSAQVADVAREEAGAVLDAADCLRAAGLRCNTVAVGSTPTVAIGAAIEGITEIRPGNYVFNDAIQLALGVARQEQCSLRVAATVVSRPVPERVVLDVGSKTLSSDRGAHGNNLVRGFGVVIGHPEFHIERLSEELAVLAVPSDSVVVPGDRLEIIPNHACTVTNLVSSLNGVRRRNVAMKIPVVAKH